MTLQMPVPFDAKVPLPGRRLRIPQSAIESSVKQIVQRFDPNKILLFGSYAYGTPQPDSDVDILVVMETKLKETEQAIRICQSIEYHFGLDLLVYTPDNLARRLALGDSFIKEILSKGKVLYERPDH
jgi:predicted nucleotidyltransferase